MNVKEDVAVLYDQYDSRAKSFLTYRLYFSCLNVENWKHNQTYFQIIKKQHTRVWFNIKSRAKSLGEGEKTMMFVQLVQKL